MGISNLIFLLLLIVTVVLFVQRVKFIRGNILLGKPLDLSDNPSARWKKMFRVAMGQSKMTVRPISGILHIFVYLGFVIINLEILEIVLDGLLGTHRLFTQMIGGYYKSFINVFEILALLVFVSCLVFLVRRNVIKLKRFWSKEMTSWPRSDANIILIVECFLMAAFLTMNAADGALQMANVEDLGRFMLEHYSGVEMAGSGFLISSFIAPLLPTNFESLALIERICWWFHISGVLAFLVYVTYSKHLHIFLAFPNTYYSKLQPKGQLNNLASVKKEVELMMNPSADPYATPPPSELEDELPSFGAKEVTDLSWKQLMDSYSCTECGRCTSVCPANLTGKILSPRKVMMDTRDRLEEYSVGKSTNGRDFDDEKKLLGDYITPEELWACTSCNACTDACPILIDPLSIIVDLRRSLVMEDSAAPTELNGMFSNIENNGAPWQFAQADRLNWKDE